MLVVHYIAFWIPLVAAILCMILVRGKRLAALGLAIAWLLLNVVVFAIGMHHCWTGCHNEPWYVLGSIVASLVIGVFLLVLFGGWIWRRNVADPRP